MRKQKISRKDILLLGLVYAGLLALVLILPEHNSALSGLVLGLYAVVSFIAVEKAR